MVGICLGILACSKDLTWRSSKDYTRGTGGPDVDVLLDRTGELIWVPQG